MWIFRWADRIGASPLRAWSLSLAAVVIAVLLRFAADDVLPPGFPYLTFFPAVILTGFFAGFYPGLLCAVLCGFAAWYWFIPPFGSWALSLPVLIALAFYAGVVGVDLLLIRVMQRAVANLRAERVLSQALLAEQQQRERRQRVLQRELSHRMKNTLAMVQAVVGQSLRHAASVAEASEMATARIQALGRSQDMLTESNWQAADIRHVVDSTLEPYRDGEGRFAVTGPALDMGATQSMGLALLLHELATNAVKYGALSRPGGRICVGWARADDGGFTLTWRERGGPDVVVPSRRGFGSRLIERVIPGYFRGHASIEYEASGVVFTLVGVVTLQERSEA